MAHYAPPSFSGPSDLVLFNDTYFSRTTYSTPRYPTDTMTQWTSGVFNFDTSQATQTIPLILVADSPGPNDPFAPVPGVYVLSVMANVGSTTTTLVQVYFMVQLAYASKHGKEIVNGWVNGANYLGAAPVIPANTVALVNPGVAPTGQNWSGYSLVKNNFTLTAGKTVGISVSWSLACYALTTVPTTLDHVLSSTVIPYYSSALAFDANNAGASSLVTESALSGPTLNLANGLYLLSFTEITTSAASKYTGGVVFAVGLSNLQQVFTVLQRIGSASNNGATAGLFVYDTTNQLWIKNSLASAHIAKWIIFKFV